MADDYTPTTEEVANVYESAENDDLLSSRVYRVMAERRQAFFAWLAAHDAEKRAEWDDRAEQWKAVANSADDLLRAVMGALGIRPDQDPVIEARRIAAALAEQGETDGRREYAAAYRARNGNVIPLGAETVVQDDAEAVRAEFEREDPDGPTYFVASRILPPWLPVPDTTNTESEDEK